MSQRGCRPASTACCRRTECCARPRSV